MSAQSSIQVPAGWRATGDLDHLLDRSRVVNFLRSAALPVTAADVVYLRFKPGQSAMVGLLLTARAGGGLPFVLPGYVRTFTDGRAELLVAKWRHKRVHQTVLGPGVRTLPGGMSVLCLFPNDAALAALPQVAPIQKLKRILGSLPAVTGDGARILGRESRVHTIRYKPERRWIARADLSLRPNGGGRRSLSVIVRLFTDERAERIARAVGSLRAAGLERHLPRPLGCAAAGRLYVEQAISGEALLPEIYRGIAPAEQLAEVLLRLHRTDGAVSEVCTPLDLLRRARHAASSLAGADAAWERPLARVLATMRETLPAARRLATLHGDFHPHQVLVADGLPVLVDFERAARGDPLQDVGNFAARILVRAQREPSARQSLLDFVERFLGTYENLAGRRPRSETRFFVLAGLLDAALLPFRRQDVDCRAQAAAVVAVAESTALEDDRFSSLDGARIESAREWHVLYPRRSGPWPGFALQPNGERAYGTLLPEEGLFRRSDMSDDPELAHLGDWASKGELIAYRRGRRAVVRVRHAGDVAYAKLLRPHRARRLAERHRALASSASAGSPRLPRLIDASCPEGVVLFEGIRARPLHTFLMRGAAERELESTARSLSSWHALPIPAIGLEPHAHSGEPERWLEVVARAEPGRLRKYAVVARALAASPPARSNRTPQLLHGDLHDRNLLVEGGQVWLLDLDSLRVGDAEADIGNLAAHMILRTLQRGSRAAEAYVSINLLVDAYRAAGGELGNEALQGWTAHTLFRLACIYPFRARWRHLAEVLLAEVFRWRDETP